MIRIDIDNVFDMIIGRIFLDPFFTNDIPVIKCFVCFTIWAKKRCSSNGLIVEPCIANAQVFVHAEI